MANVSQQGGKGAGLMTTMAEVLWGERPILPTNVRTYAQGILGRNEPITGRDFSDAEIDVIQEISRSGGRFARYPNPSDFATAKENSIMGPALEKLASKFYLGAEDDMSDYATADAVGSVLGTLGEFSSVPTADGYRVRDTYDFHEEWDNGGGPIFEQIIPVLRGDENMMSFLETVAARSRNLAGGYVTGDKGQGGIPVDFTIPYEDGNERDQMNRKRIIQQLLSGM